MRLMKNARATTSAAMRRLNTTGSLSPRTVAQSASTVMPNVVVFTPPPVPPGDAPMNISSIVTKSAGTVMAPTSIVLNPAVRGVTAANHAASSDSPDPIEPSVRGLAHSSTRKASVAEPSMPAVRTTASFVCSV